MRRYLNNPNYRLVRREHHIIQESEVIKDIEINKTETEILVINILKIFFLNFLYKINYLSDAYLSL